MIPSVTEEFLPTADGSIWHGPAPRLATADEFTSYAEMPTTLDFGYAAVRLNAATISAPTIDVTVQLSAPLPITFHQVYLESWAGSSYVTTHASPGVSVSIPADTWATHTFNLVAGVDYDRGDIEAAIAAGQLCALGFAEGGWGTPGTVYYSQILVSIGAHPHQIFQRGDSLGAGGGLVFGPSTRQSSGLVFGTH